MLGLTAGRFFTGTEVQYRTQRRRPRPDAVSGAVRAERHRSDRQDGARRQPSATRSSACSTSGPASAASTPARTTSSSFPTRPTSGSSACAASRRPRRGSGGTLVPIQIAAVPRDGVDRRTAIADVERVMRIRHGLQARRAERLRHRDPGRDPRAVGSDQPGDVPRADRDLVDRADGRRHRRDGDHVDLGDRADARNRRPQGARRAARRRSCFSS